MKILINFLTLFALYTIPATSGDPIDAVRFLEGTWKMENKQVFESWSVAGNSLKGSSYKINGGQKVVSEELSIQVSDGKLVYQALVFGQNDSKPVLFTLNADVKNKCSFENLSHDFPKKIQYTKIDAATLFVEVLGDGDQGFSYKMMKQ